MRHRIFTGSFAALEGRFVKEIGELQKDDPLAPAAILLGSNVLAAYLKYRIAERGRAVANLRFYTFLDLVTRLASPSLRDTKRPRLPRLGAGIILNQILKTGGPKVFEKVSAFAGFRGAMLDTFRDLRDAGVTQEQFALSMSEIGRRRPDRKEHLEGVANLFREFRQKAALFRDVDDDFRDAVGNSARAAELLGCSRLLIYGIYDVTGQQADLLRGLRDGLELTYFVPSVNGAASGFAGPFMETRSRELGVKPEALNARENDDSDASAAAHTGASVLAARIFALSGAADSPNREVKPDGSFALVSVPGDSRMSVEVVREVLRAVREGVISGFHESAVFLRHPEEQASVLTEAFRLRGIPFFLHGGSFLAQRPLSRAVLAIASLDAGFFPRQAVLRTMELIQAALPPASGRAWDASGWREISSGVGVLSGVDSWDSATEALVRDAQRGISRAREVDSQSSGEIKDEDEPKRLPLHEAMRLLEAGESLRSAWVHLRRAAADWPERLSWKEWAELLEQRLDPLFSESEDWHSFLTVLDEIGTLDELARTGGMKQQVERADATRSLEELLESLARPEGRFQRSGVNILSIASARGLRFPLVIVPGLDEGRFPARLRQDPLLLDEERKLIGDPSRLPLKLQRGEEEKLLFDMAIRAAEKRLVLLCSRLDEGSDRERIPSDFFLRAAAAARGSHAGLRELTEEAVPGFRSVSLDRPVSTGESIFVDEGEVRLGLITGSEEPTRALESIAAEEEFRLARPKAFDDARWQRRLTRFDGYIRDPALVRWVARRFGPGAGQVSPSSMETYARCPYQFFLGRVMELEAWEEPGPALGLEPRERGSLIHAILESFLRDLTGARFLAAPVQELEPRLHTLAFEMLEKNRPEGVPDLLWEIESESLLRLLRNWLLYEKERQNSGLFPACLEKPFGELPGGQKASQLRMKAGKHLFEFRGKIDRVDVSSDGTHARVIDYKTGNLPDTMSAGKATALMGGEKMQVALYSAALSVLPEFREVRVVEGEYLHLQPDDERLVSRSLSPEVLKQASERLPEILAIMAEGIEGGVFFARASGSVFPRGHCNFCDFLTVCGKDRVRRQERKSADPAVRRFRQILDVEGTAEAEE